jgi:hypothetical protein
MADDLVIRLRKQAKCVYLAAEQGPADDLSDGLTKAADEIERLRQKVDHLEQIIQCVRLAVV